MLISAMISRRKLLTDAVKVGPLACVGFIWPELTLEGLLFGSEPYLVSQSVQDLYRKAPRARYWISAASPGVDCLKCHKPQDDLSDRQRHVTEKEPAVRCLLCARMCIISAGRRGMCRARMNIGGELRSLVYGRPLTQQIDPIEKKPFYHFLPGSQAYSLATSGCPLRCKFCQNWQISQASPEDYSTPSVSPAEIVDAAVSRSAPVIAFTYSEPTVFTEYLVDIAQAARSHHRRCLLVSCGFMNSEPLAEMCGVLDGIKIDLKGYDESFYRRVCDAELGPVLRSIKQVAKSGVHLEIVNLVVPTLNDSDKMLRGLVNWVMNELGPDVPIHFTGFHPDYQLLNLPPTPTATLERARAFALEKGIHYPYVGNVPDHPGNHTYCPVCGKIVIKRQGFFVMEMNLKDGSCKFCGSSIAGVWS